MQRHLDPRQRRIIKFRPLLESAPGSWPIRPSPALHTRPAVCSVLDCGIIFGLLRFHHSLSFNCM